jgi:lipopolysaccharide transport system permease protein
VTRVVYTSTPQLPLARLLLPNRILADLLRHRDLIVAYTRREFQATHRATYLGLVWTVLAPLIMLALFVGVFGYIFKGRFLQTGPETPAQFALALFVGLAFFNCVAQSMGSACSLVVANTTYVKTLAFPLEILSVSAVLNVLLNLAIGLGLCFTAFVYLYGVPHLSAICLPLYVVCIALICLGISWFLSAISVFVRDVAGIVPPVSLVLMFGSSVFFPMSSVSPRMRWLLELNPLAVIIEQARGCFLYGQWPDFRMLGVVFVVSLLMAVAGYWVFMRAKPAFADVI